MTQQEDGGLLSRRSRRCFKASTTSMAVTRRGVVKVLRESQHPTLATPLPRLHVRQRSGALLRIVWRPVGPWSIVVGRPNQGWLPTARARVRRTVSGKGCCCRDPTVLPVRPVVPSHQKQRMGGAVQRSAAAWACARGKRGAGKTATAMGQRRAARCEQGDAEVWQQAARTASVVGM